jgi:hypothetical protein
MGWAQNPWGKTADKSTFAKATADKSARYTTD